MSYEIPPPLQIPARRLKPVIPLHHLLPGESRGPEHRSLLLLLLNNRAKLQIFPVQTYSHLSLKHYLQNTKIRCIPGAFFTLKTKMPSLFHKLYYTPQRTLPIYSPTWSQFLPTFMLHGHIFYSYRYTLLFMFLLLSLIFPHLSFFVPVSYYLLNSACRGEGWGLINGPIISAVRDVS
jgi:hypothetical protein